MRNLEEFSGGILAIGQYFGMVPTEEGMQSFADLLTLERMHAAWSDGSIVGGAGAFQFDLSVPGGDLPTAGITVVGVAPTHRRRGVMRALMRTQLDEAHERGEPLAALWASEETIYGRFGFGLASFCGEITLAHEHAVFAAPVEPAGTLRLIDADEALETIPPVFERVRRVWPGMFSRNRVWWENRELADPAERREGAGPKRWVVYEREGTVEGYAAYRHKPGFEGGTTIAELRVVEAQGVTPEAVRDVWAYLLAIDWIATVKAYLLPPDHPLFLLVAKPRRLRYRMGDGIWVRLVDVGAALSGRAYSSDGSIVFDVADDFCPWNEGRWQLQDGKAARTDADPDLRLPVQSLGSALLGGISFAELHRAGRLVELQEGAVTRADALFRWDRHPWCPAIF
ncbi:MAG TPA: GNAT family N-acetyltransferase [Gaiellaceae bacterium]|nr:GNAT family N-acetyltransferase [Gaiellaceae bacterium]